MKIGRFSGLALVVKHRNWTKETSPADVFFIEILHTNSGLPSRLASFNMYPRILHLFFPDGTSDLNNCTNRGTKLMAHNNIGTKIHVELPAG